MKKLSMRLSMWSLVLFFLPLLVLIACRESPVTVAPLAPTAAATPVADEEGIQPEGSNATTAPEVEPTVELAEPAAVTTTATTPTPPPPTFTPEPTLTPTPETPPVDSYQIINTYPHDPEAFTQGLVFDNGNLYEGTGLWGQSSLRQVALESGLVLRLQPLEDQYFGEGITVFGDRIYQLTWQEQTGFIYDKNSFERLETFSYPHEGWGITHDGQRLIVSDGTSTIRYWDPATLQETGRISVRDNAGPLNRMNELEYVNGEIWAHIWLTDLIARIDPETGFVKGYIDLTGLLDPSTLTQPVDVLNGIAYDPASGRIFVTGKLWPALFEIQVVPGS
jgi:glutaminyl-peptide cyclotransferase